MNRIASFHLRKILFLLLFTIFSTEFLYSQNTITERCKDLYLVVEDLGIHPENFKLKEYYDNQYSQDSILDYYNKVLLKYDESNSYYNKYQKVYLLY